MTRKLSFPPLPAFFAVLATLPVSSAWADWQARLQIQVKGQKEASGGKIYSKGDRIRMEVDPGGRQMIILADAQGGQASMLMPAQKMAMAMPKAMAEKQVLTCSAADVDGCFKKKGFKAVGKETVGGHPCAILEGMESQSGMKIRQRVWRPLDLREVYMLKSVSRLDDGTEVTTEVKDLKVGKLEEALFLVPADYKKMQLPDFSKFEQAN